MKKKENFMKIVKVFFAIAVIAIACSAGYYLYQRDGFGDSSLKIQDFQLDKDGAAIDELFHQGDNWYWMICNESSATYSVDFMLRNKSSVQYEKRRDLIIKVAKKDNKIVGFLAYFPKSAHVWHLLFLLVDKDFRRQGIAKKLLKFVVNDMVHRGALRVDLATRNNNFRAQSLYKNFGFKQTHIDEEFAEFSWYKS